MEVATIEKLDEQTLRRPDFRGGHPVTLGDGGEWFIPRPRALFVPDDCEEGVKVIHDLGPEYDALADAAEGVAEDDGIGMIRTEMAVFKYLLTLNYQLDSAGFRDLLRLDYTSPEGERVNSIRQDLLAVTRGQTPAKKAPSDSSD